MKPRKIIATNDNSKTLLIPELGESYHSRHGARTESYHVFIKEGIEQIALEKIKIFEMGFGTGLNALLSLEHSILTNRHLIYRGIEKYPLVEKEFSQLDYPKFYSEKLYEEAFERMHLS